MRLKFLLIGPVRIYEILISPLLGAGKCRYYPTCSAYAREAIERHGAAKGGILAARRLLSCHPWSRRPFLDPVPSDINGPAPCEKKDIPE
jgi:putative membrane protein insertion efficiency factor